MYAEGVAQACLHFFQQCDKAEESGSTIELRTHTDILWTKLAKNF